MKRIFISTAVLSFVLMLGQAAIAQDLATRIVGVWKVVDITRTEVASGKIEKPYGEKPAGYYIYSAGGHFSWTFIAEDRKAPAGAFPTDAERVELFKTMSFGTGTYKVEGNKVILRYDSSWVQSWTGTERLAQPEIAGNKMTITSAPFKHPITGVDAFTINTYERAE